MWLRHKPAVSSCCQNYIVGPGPVPLLNSFFTLNAFPLGTWLWMERTSNPCTSRKESEGSVRVHVLLDTHSRVLGTFQNTESVSWVLGVLAPELVGQLNKQKVLVELDGRYYSFQDPVLQRPLRELGISKGSLLIKLVRAKDIPDWEDRSGWDAIPKRLSVEEFVYNLTYAFPYARHLPRKREFKFQDSERSFELSWSLFDTDGGRQVTEPPSLSDREVMAFIWDDDSETKEEPQDLADDFFEITEAELMMLHRELIHERKTLEDRPLTTQAVQAQRRNRKLLSKLERYKNSVVRVQFPDRTVLQGVFRPLDTIADVKAFTRKFLKHPDTEFYLFTAPPKVVLSDGVRLVDADLTPYVKLYFGLVGGLVPDATYLRMEIVARLTSRALASAAAASAIRQVQTSGAGIVDSPESTRSSQASKSSLPKWFKIGQ